MEFSDLFGFDLDLDEETKNVKYVIDVSYLFHIDTISSISGFAILTSEELPSVVQVVLCRGCKYHFDFTFSLVGAPSSSCIDYTGQVSSIISTCTFTHSEIIQFILMKSLLLTISGRDIGDRFLNKNQCLASQSKRLGIFTARCKIFRSICFGSGFTPCWRTSYFDSDLSLLSAILMEDLNIFLHSSSLKSKSKIVLL
jgi:hypothetical protein